MGGGAATTVTGAPSGRELAETLAGHGIGEAWVSALGAVWAAEPMTSNRELAAVVDGVEGLRVVPVINPVLPGWEEDVAEVATWAGVRAVRWLPVSRVSAEGGAVAGGSGAGSGDGVEVGGDGAAGR